MGPAHFTSRPPHGHRPQSGFRLTGFAGDGYIPPRMRSPAGWPPDPAVGGQRSRRRFLSPRFLLTAVRDYGLAYCIEVVIFFVLLEGFQVLGYGGIITPVRAVTIGVVIVAIAVGAGEVTFKLYRRVWAVASLSDAIAIAWTVIEACLIITAINGALPYEDHPFRFLVPLLAAPAIVGAIAIYRLAPRLFSSANITESRLLIVVPDTSAYAVVKALVQQHGNEWAPVAILTDAPGEVHKTVMGIPVVGRPAELRHWIGVTRAQGVAFVLGGPTPRPETSRGLFHAVQEAELPIFIVPGPDEWLQWNEGARLRQVSADDLVGRQPRELDLEAARPAIANRTVLVTGAAGSIGSELSHLLATLKPSRLVLVDFNESGLFDVAEELRQNQAADVRECLVSITDRDALMAVFNEERPDIVFHVAAYKHVPLLESHPEQAVMTNVVGARNTISCAEASRTGAFVLISTDKAVARQSVMGCTKRLCELMVLAHQGQMKCWAVRFGNVVGSRGSVVPIFERQIQRGGPVTITHPDMTRFMMTIKEAASLVITTTVFARAGHLYMLNMGDPIRILDLARALIRSRGLRPQEDIEIAFTGLRPGERLTEELTSDDEATRPTEHPDVMEVLSPTLVTQTELDFLVDKLQALALEQRSTELIRLLRKAAKQPYPIAEKLPSTLRHDRSEQTEPETPRKSAPRSHEEPRS
jgi:FlaA1/EpsC-like NDP-sugar epimerase